MITFNSGVADNYHLRAIPETALDAYVPLVNVREPSDGDLQTFPQRIGASISLYHNRMWTPQFKWRRKMELLVLAVAAAAIACFAIAFYPMGILFGAATGITVIVRWRHNKPDLDCPKERAKEARRIAPMNFTQLMQEYNAPTQGNKHPLTALVNYRLLNSFNDAEERNPGTASILYHQFHQLCDILQAVNTRTVQDQTVIEAAYSRDTQEQQNELNAALRDARNQEAGGDLARSAGLAVASVSRGFGGALLGAAVAAAGQARRSQAADLQMHANSEFARLTERPRHSRSRLEQAVDNARERALNQISQCFEALKTGNAVSQ